jgi:pimeloyl-ACP methyl ester carboxylesterase
MDAALDAPDGRYYWSQGLGLHFTDWGNPSAPPLILVHGGLDHSRSWDHLARALRATGSSYSLADHVYDLTCLMKSAGFEKVTIIGHSMGGMVNLTYAGNFPNKVSRLVVLDGVTSGSPIGSAISTSSRSGKSTAMCPWPMGPSEF